jgi:TolB-like protein
LLILLSSPAIAAELKEAVEQLAVQLTNSVPEGRTLRVAVTDFPDLEEVTSNLGRFIPERLTTRLSAQPQKFRVIERRRLNKVLGELRFSMSDLIDPNKAKQLGKMLGVEAIVVGTVSDLGNVVEVDARIIEVETNNILPGVTASISKNDTVKQMMEAGRVRSATLTGSGLPTGSAPPVYMGTAKYQEFPKFRVEVEQLQVSSDGTVTVFLTYTNKTQEDLLIALCKPHNKTFIMDSDGNNYSYRESGGIGDVCLRVQAPLTVSPDLSATASLRFRNNRVVSVGKTFSLSSEQVIVKPARPGRRPPRVSTQNVSIRNIEPR